MLLLSTTKWWFVKKKIKKSCEAGQKSQGWSQYCEDIAQELWIAREALSHPGKRTDLTSEQKFQGWNQYCIDIGSSRQVVNRWLASLYTICQKV